MFKKILFITDNLSFFQRIEEFLKANLDKDITYTFATSPFSVEMFKEHLHALKVYDLRNAGDVEEIISSFDLVISVHCKQLFPSQLVKSVKCINIHPGYNPINRGWYPQVFAIIEDLQIGATIHEIDEYLDHGPIIDRMLVEKHPWDTSLSLYNRVVDAEMALFKNNFKAIVQNTYTTVTPETEGNLYLKKDFNHLCRLDLAQKVTLKEAIDKLRALTHGSFKNAYFIDEKTGQKVHVQLILTPEG